MEDSLTVTELTTRIRFVLESDSALRDVWVTGEVSNMTRASSGHWYFSIKDASSQLKCVMFRQFANFQGFTPNNGDQINAHGAISVYESRGEYQLYADAVQPIGVGDLYQQFEALKQKLQAEGLFDEDHKRPIPEFPHKIGVITSPNAAAFQDIQNVLRRRFPLAEVILSPTLVQGIEAPPQIIAAIHRLNDYADVDVILVCRGGGSIEDLWAFNDEGVARAIYNSHIPTISGVGHEVDFTIADFVADLRAPTPSAAAELATPNFDDLRVDVQYLDSRLQQMMRDKLTVLRRGLDTQYRTLHRYSPQSLIRDNHQRLDELTERLNNSEKRHLALLRERLKSRTAALYAANPDAILARGYAIVTRSEDGLRVIMENDVKPGTGVTIKLHKGELKARIEDKESHERYKRTLF